MKTEDTLLWRRESGKCIRDKVAQKLQRTADILYPLRCPVCDEPVDRTGEKICLGCLPKLSLLTPPWCMKCGKKVAEDQDICDQCRQNEHHFERGRALYEYSGAVMSIYRFKYRNRREYAAFFGEQTAEYLGAFIKSVDPDCLVPIPLHRRRLNVRGYNQAECLAKEIGRQLGIPVREDLLKRVKNTRPLKNLNPLERQNNMKKAFLIDSNDVKLRVIILIDDIYTTGATMDEAAKVLRRAGVEKVYCITLACGAGV